MNVKPETAPTAAAPALKRQQPLQPESFSLAHLSDLHLTTLEHVTSSQLLSKRMLGYFSWRRKRRIVHSREIVESLLEDLRVIGPDHIAVTGDLTHLGLPSEFAEAGQWLTRLGHPEQVTVIPGNHEAYVGRAWGRSSPMWAPYLAPDRQQDIAGAAGGFPSLRIRGQVALISLCSARPSLPFFAIGSLGKRQLTGLEALLKITGEQGLMRVVLIHHPPAPGATKWRKRLTDSKAFSSVLSRQGAELVLHGHTHTPTFSELPTPFGKIPAIGTPSASELNPRSGRRAQYNIYRIRPDGLDWELTMTVRGYSETLGQFRFEQERTMTIRRFNPEGNQRRT